MNIGNASGDDELTLVQKALKNKRRKVVHVEYSGLNLFRQLQMLLNVFSAMLDWFLLIIASI
jgi:hypothetical protein